MNVEKYLLEHKWNAFLQINEGWGAKKKVMEIYDKYFHSFFILRAERANPEGDSQVTLSVENSLDILSNLGSESQGSPESKWYQSPLDSSEVYRFLHFILLLSSQGLKITSCHLTEVSERNQVGIDTYRIHVIPEEKELAFQAEIATWIPSWDPNNPHIRFIESLSLEDLVNAIKNSEE